MRVRARRALSSGLATLRATGALAGDASAEVEAPIEFVGDEAADDPADEEAPALLRVDEVTDHASSDHEGKHRR